MNSILKGVGLIIIAIIGVLMIISRLTTESPSNAFLLITGIISIIGLGAFIIINRFFED